MSRRKQPEPPDWQISGHTKFELRTKGGRPPRIREMQALIEKALGEPGVSFDTPIHRHSTLWSYEDPEQYVAVASITTPKEQ